jgi:hypothetical protein
VSVQYHPLSKPDHPNHSAIRSKANGTTMTSRTVGITECFVYGTLPGAFPMKWRRQYRFRVLRRKGMAIIPPISCPTILAFLIKELADLRALGEDGGVDVFRPSGRSGIS